MMVGKIVAIYGCAMAEKKCGMHWRNNNTHPADQTKCLCLTKDNVYMTCIAYKSAAFRGDWGWLRYDSGQPTGYELTSIEKWCPLYEIVEELNNKSFREDAKC